MQNIRNHAQRCQYQTHARSVLRSPARHRAASRCREDFTPSQRCPAVQLRCFLQERHASWRGAVVATPLRRLAIGANGRATAFVRIDSDAEMPKFVHLPKRHDVANSGPGIYVGLYEASGDARIWFCRERIFDASTAESAIHWYREFRTALLRQLRRDFTSGLHGASQRANVYALCECCRALNVLSRKHSHWGILEGIVDGLQALCCALHRPPKNVTASLRGLVRHSTISKLFIGSYLLFSHNGDPRGTVPESRKHS